MDRLDDDAEAEEDELMRALCVEASVGRCVSVDSELAAERRLGAPPPLRTDDGDETIEATAVTEAIEDASEDGVA